MACRWRSSCAASADSGSSRYRSCRLGPRGKKLADQRFDYSGRLTAHLPEATRLIMVKADGTLAIHSDGNASNP